jgi:hypothetical protein
MEFEQRSANLPLKEVEKAVCISDESGLHVLFKQ